MESVMKDFKALIDKGGHIKKKDIEDIYKRLDSILKKDSSATEGMRDNCKSSEGKNDNTEVVSLKAVPVWKGLFGGSTSINGYPIDVLKSAMQKYCRRRMTDEMIWCVNELDAFSLIPEGKGEPVRTNMFNRLKIILVEDLVFADYKTFLYCMENLNKWNNEGRVDSSYLYKVCKALTSGKLCRLCSDIKAYWRDRINNDEELYPKYEKMLEKIEVQKSDKDDLMVCKYMELFKIAFNNKSEECFYWFFRIMEKADEKVKGKNRFKKHGCEYILWEWLYEVCESDLMKNVFDLLLFNFHEKRNERYMFALNAICLVFYKIKMDDESLKDEKIDLDKYKIMNKNKMAIDDFCIDMHCAEGKAKGKNKKTFALEGSVVVNENKEYYKEEWRKVYLSLKGVNSPVAKIIEKDEEKKSLAFADIVSENPDFCNNGMVCGNKKVCINGIINGKEVVLKESTKGANGHIQVFVDSLKCKAELLPLNARILNLDVSVEKVNKKVGMYTDNYVLVDRPTEYVVMDKIRGCMLTEKQKILLKEFDVRKEYMKIICFRSLLRVSDTNVRNIFIDENNLLYSIDEMNVFCKDNIKWNNALKTLVKQDIEDGKFDDIFNRFRNIKREDVEDVFAKFGFLAYLDEFMERKNRLKSIIENM